MYKSEIAQRLRELQKRSGVRQKDIAEKLGLSCASVSQFMHGVSLPRMEQFRTMLEMMDVPAAEAGKLSFKLMMARAGSQMNDPQRMLTIPESAPAASQTPKNADQKKDPFLWDHECLDYFVSEDPDAVQPGIPVISITDMNVFDLTVPLETYARNRSSKILPFSSMDIPGTVLILAEGESLALPHCGTLRLSVIDHKKENSSSLELYGFEDDTYRIIPNREHNSGHWETFFPVPQFEESDIRWKLPLLEVGITPVYEHKKAQTKK